MKKIEKSKVQRVEHPIPPLFDKESRILILGSFPSVKSREAAFFYGHPQNRFWKMMATLLSEPFPESVEERSAMLHRNHIAVWDTIASCEIVGSSDSSIRNVIPNDISMILEAAPIVQIYCNGAKSHEYYKKYIEATTHMTAIRLPSTSPANAACSMEKLLASWRQILAPLKIVPAGISHALLNWYDYNARILPWRSDPTPYHVWVSEIMLQQTRVEAVKKYYDRWMKRLPEIKDLAEIADDELMKLWEGLGYYNRVRNMKLAAMTIMAEYGGQIPADYDKILSLKGIGEYTAGAISSIAFGLPKAAVDGNVLRVFSRILAEDGQINKTKVKKTLEREVMRIMPLDRPGDFNQALMDLGATVCLPNGQPVCQSCPWENICQAHKLEKECDFPVKEKKKARKVEEKAVFIIEYGDQIFLHKRPEKGLLADLWEFPNVEGAFTLEKVRDFMERKKTEDLTERKKTEDLAEREKTGDLIEREKVRERMESQEERETNAKKENMPAAEYKESDIYELSSLGEGKHIFSHVEWHMTGYRLRLKHLTDSMRKLFLEKNQWVLVSKREMEENYAIPSAFEIFKKRI